MRNLQNLVSIPKKRLAASIERWRVELGRKLLEGMYQIVPEGILVGGVLVRGEYHHRIREREREFTVDHNLVVDQGILKLLGIGLFTDAKIPAYYLGICSGTTAVAPNLTATSFAGTLNEIVSSSEGYASATRPQWTPSAPAAGVIGNLASKASFSIVTASSVKITAAGLLSDNARGGTSGILISASQFANGREVYNGETFDLGYQVSLTD